MVHGMAYQVDTDQDKNSRAERHTTQAINFVTVPHILTYPTLMSPFGYFNMVY